MDTLRALVAASEDLRFDEILIAQGEMVAMHSLSNGTNTIAAYAAWSLRAYGLVGS